MLFYAFISKIIFENKQSESNNLKKGIAIMDFSSINIEGKMEIIFYPKEQT